MELEHRLVDGLRDFAHASSGLQHVELDQLFEETMCTSLLFKEQEDRFLHASSGLQHVKLDQLFEETVCTSLSFKKQEDRSLHASSELQPVTLSQCTEEPACTALPYKEPEDSDDHFKMSSLEKHCLQSLLHGASAFQNSSVSFDTTLDTIDEYDELVTHYPWTLHFYHHSKEISTVTQVSDLYKDISELIKKGGTLECDKFLKFVEPKELSNVLLVGLLRLTNSYKEDLKSWKSLKSKVVIELKVRGFDSARKLRGL
ncbi:TPA: hypothetical protein ACN32W_000455 [Vibrio parahaemolyticus]|nr:hypothetical protein [Vibrio parahaemolyticus]HCH0842023.1 hypothetical protein [Vibrio parahaemolyticus]HCM1572527.1 hypothetical protein [Vibrio parahaemolyticus]